MSLPVGRKLTRRQKWMLLGVLMLFDAMNGVVIGSLINGLPTIQGLLQ